MTVAERVTRFPEIPSDLHDAELLKRFAELFAPYLTTALKPGACSQDWTPENKAYMTLVGPMDIYRYGLSTRERVLEQVTELIERFETAKETFESTMMEAR